MMKIKKAFSIRIISIVVAVTFFVTTSAYGIDLPNKNHLRTPLIANSDEGKTRLEQALSRLDDSEELELHLQNLHHKSGWVRSTAEAALRESKDPRAVDGLVEILLDDDADKIDVRRTVAMLLGEIGDPRALESLEEILLDGKVDVKIRRAAAEALGDIGDSGAVNILLKALDSDAALVRSSTAKALGKIGDPSAVEGLLKRLGDEKSFVRDFTAEALGKIGDPRAVDELMKLLTDKDEHVRLSTVKALGAIGGLEVVNGLIAALNVDDRYVRRIASELLGKMGDEGIIKMGDRRVVAALIERLDDVDGLVRKNALDALVILGDEDTIFFLDQFLLGVPESQVFYIYDDHDSEVEYTQPFEFDRFSAGGVRLVAEEKKEHPLRKKVPEAIEEIFRKLKKQRTERRFDLEQVRERRLPEFLRWLKEKGLEDDIVAFGGGVRDAYTGKRLNDIDITIKISLTQEERMAFLGTRSQANERVYLYAVEKLKLLAEALGVDYNLFLQPPNAKDKILWQRETGGEVEIQYSGPIMLTTPEGKVVYLKRAFVDAETGVLYSHGTNPALIQMAIDYEGNVYGRVHALDDFDNGITRVVGDGHNFTMGRILRLLRLEHEFGLEILDDDYRLVIDALEKFRLEERQVVNPQVQQAIGSQVEKIIREAQSPQAAHEELIVLGIYELLKDKWDIDMEKDMEIRSKAGLPVAELPAERASAAGEEAELRQVLADTNARFELDGVPVEPALGKASSIPLRELQSTVVLFSGDEVRSNPDGFKQALNELDGSNSIVVVTDLKKDLENFCIDNGIDITRFYIRTPEELGLSGFNLDQVMSLIMGIDDLRCIPLTDSLCETYEALKKARDKV